MKRKFCFGLAFLGVLGICNGILGCSKDGCHSYWNCRGEIGRNQYAVCCPACGMDEMVECAKEMFSENAVEFVS